MPRLSPLVALGLAGCFTTYAPTGHDCPDDTVSIRLEPEPAVIVEALDVGEIPYHVELETCPLRPGQSSCQDWACDGTASWVYDSREDDGPYVEGDAWVLGYDTENTQFVDDRVYQVTVKQEGSTSGAIINTVACEWRLQWRQGNPGSVRRCEVD